VGVKEKMNTKRIFLHLFCDLVLIATAVWLWTIPTKKPIGFVISLLMIALVAWIYMDNKRHDQL
jgi:thiol:disulfide interchange protein